MRRTIVPSERRAPARGGRGDQVGVLGDDDSSSVGRPAGARPRRTRGRGARRGTSARSAAPRRGSGARAVGPCGAGLRGAGTRRRPCRGARRASGSGPARSALPLLNSKMPASIAGRALRRRKSPKGGVDEARRAGLVVAEVVTPGPMRKFEWSTVGARSCSREDRAVTRDHDGRRVGLQVGGVPRAMVLRDRDLRAVRGPDPRRAGAGRPGGDVEQLVAAAARERSPRPPPGRSPASR